MDVKRFKIFDKIAAKLVENGIITAEDKEIYEYGLRSAATTVLNIATTILIGFIFNMIWQSILFMALYIPLRSYAGGAHARTPLKCYIFSVILTVCVLLSVRYIPYNNDSLLLLTATFISGTIIFIFAPIGDENKPLDETEIKVFKKRTRIILFAEIGLTVLLVILNLNFVAVCCVVSLMCVSLVLLLPVLQHYMPKL